MNYTTRDKSLEGKKVPWLSGLPPEVWTMIAQHIHNRRTQIALRHVCRTFNLLFASLTSEHLTVTFDKAVVPPLFYGDIPSATSHTKHLTIYLSDDELGLDDDRSWPPDATTEMASFVTRTVEAIPRLQSFSWWDQSYDDRFDLTSLVMRDPKLLDALHNHPTLERIWGNMASHLLKHIEEQHMPTSCFMPLAGFKNLTSLEMYNFHGPEDEVLPDLARTLRSCSKLNVLGLGMSCDSDVDYNDKILILWGELGFLERLCLEYSKLGEVEDRTSLMPLRLKTLRLGTFLSPYKPKASPTEENYLSKLVELEGLQKLHIWNGRYKYETVDVYERPAEIHWHLFDQCQSLQQLQITRLEDDVTEWISDKAEALEDLVITERYVGGWEGYRNASQLNLTKLTGLYISDDTNSYYVTTVPSETDSDRDSWESVESDYGYDQFQADFGPEAEAAWIEENNRVTEENYAEDDSEFSEATISEFHPETTSESGSSDVQSENHSEIISESGTELSESPDFIEISKRSHFSILDYLPDKGIHLEKLGLAIQFETQWIQLSKRLLQMRNLVHIRIMARYLGRFPPPSASYWPGVTYSKDIALRYARDMHSICPSLQYIQIKHYLWQVVPHDWSSCHKKGCAIEHDFVEIDADELAQVELFSYAMFPELSGLLGRDHPEREPTETDWKPYLDEDKSFKGPPWEFGNSNRDNTNDENPSEEEYSDDADSGVDTELQQMICVGEPPMHVMPDPKHSKGGMAEFATYLDEQPDLYPNDLLGRLYALDRESTTRRT